MWEWLKVSRTVVDKKFRDSLKRHLETKKFGKAEVTADLGLGFNRAMRT